MHSPSDTEHELLQQVRAFIARHRMLEPGDKVLVAVSGGADSVALLRVLHMLKDEPDIALHVAHLDHQLRGEASRQDAAFVEKLSRDLDISCTLGAEDVGGFVKREKRSLEEGARVVRYNFLKRVAEEVGANRIATGHTLDDQAETILYRLFRGTGSTGLRGILPVRDGVLIRPLLQTTREQVLDFLRQMGQSFQVDDSNADMRYARNRIRHEVIPLLKAQYGQGIIHRLGRAAQIVSDEDAALDRLGADALASVTKYRDNHKIVLDVTGLLGYHIALQRRILRRALHQAKAPTLGYARVERALRLLESSSGVLSMPAGLWAQRWGDQLILKWHFVAPFEEGIRMPGGTPVPQLGAVVDLRIEERSPDESKNWHADAARAAFDRAAVKGALVLRNRRPGDVVQPFGMTGHRKVKEILIDQKVPRLLRDEVPILADEEKILWVVGLATSEAARVTLSTRQVLWVECHWPRPPAAHGA